MILPLEFSLVDWNFFFSLLSSETFLWILRSGRSALKLHMTIKKSVWWKKCVSTARVVCLPITKNILWRFFSSFSPAALWRWTKSFKNDRLNSNKKRDKKEKKEISLPPRGEASWSSLHSRFHFISKLYLALCRNKKYKSDWKTFFFFFRVNSIASERRKREKA